MTSQTPADKKTETTSQDPAEKQMETTQRARGGRKGRTAPGSRSRRVLEQLQGQANDAAYFNTYAHLGVHEEMIKDKIRTETYMNAIVHHHSLIKDKVVMDVGCGTGILSIFCAQAGAALVYAVEASDIADQAKQVVEANGLADRVFVLHGRVEDIQIEEKVDVIISNWMGYMLLHESMLGSVLFARDRWLKSGGLILPSHATLYMAPITNPNRYADTITFWRNVHGIDMSVLIPFAKICAFEEPCVETILVENLLTSPHMVKHINCYTVQSQELESVITDFKLHTVMQAPMHGFAFWFDVEFNGTPMHSNDPTQPSSSSVHCPADVIQSNKISNFNQGPILSTSPADTPTHWKQTMIYLYDPMELEVGQLIKGSVIISQSLHDPRDLIIRTAYIVGGRSFVIEAVMR